MSRALHTQFLEDGFVIVRGLISQDDVRFYVARLRELAGTQSRWTEPDGVNRHDEFWPLIFNEQLLALMRELLGPTVRYLPHNDLHVGFSSFAWHRDSVARRFGEGADWDETHAPYKIARVGIYLQSYEASRFRFGVLKGSHRTGRTSQSMQRRIERRTSGVANVLYGLSGADFLGDHAEWVAPERGDCVIFDPRVLHTGSRFYGEKFSIFLAYGIENEHFRNHWHYYLRLRKDLDYSQVPDALAARLSAAGLLAEEPPADLAIESAWIPSQAYVSVAKRFK